jgi:beta-phosphoglucomutase
MVSDQVGVIFDMDGVLVDSADAHFESWRRLGRELGIDITRRQFEETFGRQNRDIIPIRFGVTDAARIATLADRKEQLYRDCVRSNPPIVDGAVALVRGLHAAGARLAVGSSGPRENIELMLRAMTVAHHFDVVVSADDVARGKPDPEVFALACERLGVAAGRCVVIEDAPAGVDAARRAGCRCVAVMMHHDRNALQSADRIVERLGDLRVDEVLGMVAI